MSRGVALAGTIYMPPQGEELSGVAVSMGSSWDARANWEDVAGPVLGLGTAVLSYDKRGFGESEGVFFMDADDNAFDILSDDLVAAARALAASPQLRPDRVGVVGSSQGGWVVPLAANKDPATIRYAVITVGGAVSSGQEGLYDELTGYSDCERTATPMEEINAAMRAAGPSGFDPKASLRAMTQPTMWVFGGLDFSHPAEFSVEKLDEIEATQPKDWEVVVLENANHDLIEGGSICQTTGPRADVLTPWRAWRDQLFGGS